MKIIQTIYIYSIILSFLNININSQQILKPSTLNKIQNVNIHDKINQQKLNQQKNNIKQIVPIKQQIIVLQKQSKLYIELTVENKSNDQILLQKSFNNVPIIRFNQIPRNQLKYISKGFFARAHLWQPKNLIVKIYKQKKYHYAIRQLKALVKVNQIYNNFLRTIITQKQKVIGFVLQRARGKAFNYIYLKHGNIFNSEITARWNILFQVRQQIRKFQKVNLCHDDIFSQNIIVNQIDQKSSNVSLQIIDYGNSFIFSYNKLSRYDTLPQPVPPQARKKKYFNATGVNAFQFGITSLHILLLRNQVKQRIKNYTQAFKNLQQKGVDKYHVFYIKSLIGNNLQIRNIALFSQPLQLYKKYFPNQIIQTKQTDLIIDQKQKLQNDQNCNFEQQ